MCQLTSGYRLKMKTAHAQKEKQYGATAVVQRFVWALSRYQD